MVGRKQTWPNDQACTPFQADLTSSERVLVRCHCLVIMLCGPTNAIFIISVLALITQRIASFASLCSCRAVFPRCPLIRHLLRFGLFASALPCPSLSCVSVCVACLPACVCLFLFPSCLFPRVYACWPVRMVHPVVIRPFFMSVFSVFLSHISSSFSSVSLFLSPSLCFYLFLPLCFFLFLSLCLLLFLLLVITYILICNTWLLLLLLPVVSFFLLGHFLGSSPS